MTDGLPACLTASLTDGRVSGGGRLLRRFYLQCLSVGVLRASAFDYLGMKELFLTDEVFLLLYDNTFIA